ncbi:MULTISPECIES: hypothetical protein [unclassified Shinella]|uniref:hypothetical protein n=1 Tax=unclassified Shinella TaxID=2643062 RepID=UPI00225D0A82|nr:MULTISPECIES: hypothetical protein [unclassified Shinella]MCO5139279.1 hypothetical protein [Shinella sp.]MDC7255992.1 hypothetical protein [Shinella sp. YE25]CAI0338828.1 conserved hypothetical protein [Rhizobiaceae bacterium]CAK7257258.1 conserved protein of unknown function [Shinella sp. WSC3-e]
MNDLVSRALAHFKEHWHIGMAGTSDAANLLDINPNTLKTRLARGQALVLRDPNGLQRSTLTFTGFHLIYNLLSDRLLRYGFASDHDETTMAHLPYVYAEWVHEHVLSSPHRIEAILRFRKEADGGTQNMVFEDGNVEDWTGDAALIVPIGTMVVRLAATVLMRTGNPQIFEQNRP